MSDQWQQQLPPIYDAEEPDDLHRATLSHTTSPPPRRLVPKSR